MLKSRFLQSGCIFRVFSTVCEPVCAGTQECRNTGTPAGAVPLSGCERLSARGIGSAFLRVACRLQGARR